jgi:hypothetical protein
LIQFNIFTTNWNAKPANLEKKLLSQIIILIESNSIVTITVDETKLIIEKKIEMIDGILMFGVRFKQK